ncbi:MAG: ABC transporter permease [Tepidiformaceae bacterium]
MATAAETTLVDPFERRTLAPAPIRAAKWVFRFARTKPLGAFGGGMLILIIFVGIFSPWLAKDGLGEVHLSDALLAPNSTYWFGTDANGGDIFSKVIYGCQVTAMVGLGTVLLVGFLSLLVGVSSGFFGGKVDFFIQRLVDIWMSFPAIFLILTLVAVLQTTNSQGFLGLGRGPEFGPNPASGPWFWNTFPRTTIVIMTLGLVLAGGASRVVRSAVLSVKATPYIEAATVLGATNWRTISRHVIPNIMPTVIVLATLQLGTAILAEATISYLGVGITNFPTWGQMLSGRTRDLAEAHLHLAIFPGMAIFFAVFGFNMLGDALRDVLDPRLRGSR